MPRLITFVILSVFFCASWVVLVSAEDVVVTETLQPSNGTGSPAFLGRYANNDLQLICQGENVKSLTGISCTSKNDCEAKRPCLKNSTGCPEPEKIWRGNNSNCLVADQSFGNCSSILWREKDPSLKYKRRLVVGFFYCLLSHGKDAFYTHFKGSRQNKPLKNNKDPSAVELQIFKGDSAIFASSLKENETVTVFSNEPVFVTCRVRKTEDISPFLLTHKNGSSVPFHGALNITKENEYTEFSNERLLIDRNWTGISCVAQQNNSLLDVDQKIIKLKIMDAHLPLVLNSATAINGTTTSITELRVDWGQKIGCSLNSLYPQQEQIFFQMLGEHSVPVPRGGSGDVLSAAGFFRFLKLAKDLNVSYTCSNHSNNNGSTNSNNHQLFLETSTPESPKLFKSESGSESGSGVQDGRSIISRKTIEIPCKFYGVPQPTVTWLRNSKLFAFAASEFDVQGNANPNASMKNYVSKLNLPLQKLDVNYQDFYPVYTCLVSNFEGTAKHDFFTATAPQIYKDHVEEIHWSVEKGGEGKNLSCIYKGGPSTRVEWFHDGLTVHDSIESTDTIYGPDYAESRLLINTLAPSAERNYTCNVFNPLGSDTKTFYVTVSFAKNSSGGGQLETGAAGNNGNNGNSNANAGDSLDGFSTLVYIILGSLSLLILILTVVNLIQCRKIRSLGGRFRTNESGSYERIVLEEQPRHSPFYSPSTPISRRPHISNPFPLPQFPLPLRNGDEHENRENEENSRQIQIQTSSFSSLQRQRQGLNFVPKRNPFLPTAD